MNFLCRIRVWGSMVSVISSVIKSEICASLLDLLDFLFVLNLDLFIAIVWLETVFFGIVLRQLWLDLKY